MPPMQYDDHSSQDGVPAGKIEGTATAHNGTVPKSEVPSVGPCAELVSAEDVFYLEWAREDVKKTVPYLNDCLQRLIVLDTALVAGSIVGLKDAMPLNWRIAVVIAMMLSLVIACIGVQPFGGALNWTDPDDIRRSEDETVKWKKWLLRIAGAIMILGMIVGVAGMSESPVTLIPNP